MAGLTELAQARIFRPVAAKKAVMRIASRHTMRPRRAGSIRARFSMVGRAGGLVPAVSIVAVLQTRTFGHQMQAVGRTSLMMETTMHIDALANNVVRLLPDAAKAEIRAKIGTIADLNLTPHAPTALYILECAK